MCRQGRCCSAHMAKTRAAGVVVRRARSWSREQWLRHGKGLSIIEELNSASKRASTCLRRTQSSVVSIL